MKPIQQLWRRALLLAACVAAITPLLSAATPAELVDELIASANQASQGLEGVKDQASAKTAEPALTQAANRFAAAKAALAALKLPPNSPEHAALYQQKGEQIQTAIKRLHNAVVQARGIPGVRRELRAVFRKLAVNLPEEDDEPNQ